MWRVGVSKVWPACSKVWRVWVSKVWPVCSKVWRVCMCGGCGSIRCGQYAVRCGGCACVEGVGQWIMPTLSVT